jgi:hypothetical protein
VWFVPREDGVMMEPATAYARVPAAVLAADPTLLRCEQVITHSF